ncbi:TonB-dependent receptor [Caulobacter segnis]|uniref:TonB-dependent receptor n=1 Tax=Caulobacter segnis TaxID=88688 RepID=UPI002861329B|nr:TonB-dependent receptor [Caulobacter segnis]MDR6624479.1 outer membrane receptor protein involved in Fe transport [Caulobacter segnis]
MLQSSLRRRLLIGLATSVFVSPALGAPALAAPKEASKEAVQTVAFDIRAGTLDGALIAFATQSGRTVAYSPSLVAGRQSEGLRGRFTPEAALDRLLAGGTIEVHRRGEKGFVLKPRKVGAVPAASLQPDDPLQGVSADGPSQLSELVVTGSLIRGPARGASPVVTVSRDDLDRTGKSTVADMLTDLPQAFGGAASADTNLANTDGSGTNPSVSTGINLRGLGASATLVLVDGRRMAGSGLNGAFADVSTLPTAAVDRVEILLDGASALYGSDAVGGVVNVILRKDFEGAETRLRIGGATGGGASERQFAQTVGKTWASGHALVSYEHWQRDHVAAEDRPYTASPDLRPLGGTDHRLFYSHPGNILALVGNAYVPTWAVPAGQLGVGLTPASFKAGTVNYENQRSQSDIMPEQNRDAVYVALGQRLTSRVELSGDLRLSKRKYELALPGTVTIFAVTNANPYFVSPDGSSSNVIGYAFTDELGPLRASGNATSVAASLGAEIDLGRSWRANIYGAYAQDVTRRDGRGRLNSRFLSEALGTIPDDPATSYSAPRDGYFNPYGDDGTNPKAVLDFIGGGYTLTRYVSTVKTLNGQADGTLLSLPGGAVKLAVGGQYREEHFDTRTISMTSRATPTTTLTGPFDRKILAGFAELRIPLVGEGNARPGLQRLELSLAGRIEHYDDVGTTTNPKVGVVWTPVESVNVRASYGTSFRAPSLPEVFQTQDGGPSFLAQGATSKLVFLRYGGNTDLQPESATSWTVGIDYSSRAVPGLKLSATWFDTAFEGQIGTPVFENIDNVLGNRAYAPFVQTLDPANAADQARLAALLAGTTSAGLYPTTAYAAIVDGRNVNTGGLHVQGVDLTARYGLPLGGGVLDLTGNVSVLLDYERKVTPGSAWLSLLNQARQPVDLRAKLGASWTREAWSLTGGLNHVDDYKTALGQPIDSWTTLDAQLSWRAQGAGWTKGLSAALSVQNLFDTDPPFYDDPQGVGYDTANADPLGRFVSFQLTKRW